MPELPDVEIFKRYLDYHGLDKEIESVEVHSEQVLGDLQPEELPDDYLLTHRSPGSDCPRCGGEIDKVKVAGRSAYFCPNCQPEER